MKIKPSYIYNLWMNMYYSKHNWMERFRTLNHNHAPIMGVKVYRSNYAMEKKTNLEILAGTKDFIRRELVGLFSENEAVIFAKLLRDCVYENEEPKHLKSLILFWLQKECYEVGRTDSNINLKDEYIEELGEIISKIYKLSAFKCYVVLDLIREYWNESDDNMSFEILSQLTNKKRIDTATEYEKGNRVNKIFIETKIVNAAIYKM